jgi:hypothetical protein
MTAAFDKFPLFLGRDHHFLSQSVKNPAPELRRIPLGDVDFFRQFGQRAVSWMEQPIENGTLPLIQGRSQVFGGTQKQGQPVLLAELAQDPIKPFRSGFSDMGTGFGTLGFGVALFFGSRNWMSGRSVSRDSRNTGS